MMEKIQLPEPRRTGGMPLMEAFSRRATHRKCSDRELPLQTLSEVLWAAWGFNRENFRTAPSSHNRQEMQLYVFLKSGIYIYNAGENTLEPFLEKDLRALTGTQDYVADTPVDIALVADTTKITDKTQQGILEAIYADAGFIAENIYLYAAQEGLNTVARAKVDKEALSTALSLQESQVITLVQSVGYPREK